MATINEGDIVKIDVPYEEDFNLKRRPVFVLEVNRALNIVKVVYCSTQKVSRNPLATEVIITDREAKLIGLEKPTRIDFTKQIVFCLSDVEKTCSKPIKSMELGNTFTRRLALAWNAFEEHRKSYTVD